MKPRRLTVLRVNDLAEPHWERDPADTPGWFDGFTIEGRADFVRRITGTTASQEFWARLPSSAQPPDLILADINFERDNESALRGKFVEIPTGLLHAIPFLTWARTSGRLCAVAFNTGDPDIFQKKADEPMRLLAVELGALAMALAGDLDDQPVTRESPDRVFGWIRERSYPNENPTAVRGAIQEFRRRLFAAARTDRGIPAAIIEPHEYVRLLSHVERARAAGQPAQPDRDGWPGVTLIRSDGTRDCLSVQSLFGDVPVLAAAMFQTGRSKQPWLVTDDAAAIGDFVQGLGQWPRLFAEAIAVVRQLPQGDAALSGTNLNRLAEDPVVRFLALALQIVRQHRFGDELWRDTYHNSDWDPITLKAASRPAKLSMAATVEWLFQRVSRAHAMRAEKNTRGERVLSRIELAEFLEDEAEGVAADERTKLTRFDREAGGGRHRVVDQALTFHVDLLCALGLIERTAPPDASGDHPEAYRLVGKPGAFSAAVPPCPDALRPAWLRSASNETGLLGALQQTLGFGAEYNPIKRIVEAVGVAPKGAEAAFLRDLVSEGTCPGWLRELCRDYAVQELGWTEESHWPRFMRTRAAD